MAGGDRTKARRRAIASLQSRVFVGDNFFGPPRGAPENDAALRRADEVDQVLHLGARQRLILLDLLQRAGGVQLRLEQVTERALQFRDHLGREAAPGQADGVGAEDPRRPAADRARERQRVLGDHRVAADEPVLADAAELVNRRARADVGVGLDRDMAAQGRVRPEDRIVADGGIVRDVHVGHEDVAIPDRRDAAAAAGAAVDRHELAENVAAADHQPGRLTLILEILRREADRSERVDLRVVADLRPAVHHRRRADAAAPANADVRTDARMRANRRAAADLRARVNDRRRVDLGLVRHQAEQQFGFGDDLVADNRRRLRARQRGAPLAERDLQPQLIARKHLAPELGVVDAAQVDPRVGRRVLAVQQQHRRHLRERLEHHHARQHRSARKMPLEEFFVDRDVLDGDEPPPRVVLGDRVHEKGRLPVAEAVQEDGNVQHERMANG